MLYAVVVKCPAMKNYVKLFNELPIKHKSNGSPAPSLKEKGKIWNDYIDVTLEELDALLDFIDKQSNKNEYAVKIRKYDKEELFILPIRNAENIHATITLEEFLSSSKATEILQENNNL